MVDIFCEFSLIITSMSVVVECICSFPLLKLMDGNFLVIVLNMLRLLQEGVTILFIELFDPSYTFVMRQIVYKGIIEIFPIIKYILY